MALLFSYQNESQGLYDFGLPEMSQPVLSTPSVVRRGAFLVLEGLDRSGKSTQCRKLVDNLNNGGIRAKAIRFPGDLSGPLYISHCNKVWCLTGKNGRSFHDHGENDRRILEADDRAR